MKTESEIRAARELHKLLAQACKTANAKDAWAVLCNEDGGPVDNQPDSELAKSNELHVTLDFIPWREGARPLTESGRREMTVEQNTLDAIQRLAEKHGTLSEQHHIDSIDGPGYGWDVTAKAAATTMKHKIITPEGNPAGHGHTLAEAIQSAAEAHDTTTEAIEAALGSEGPDSLVHIEQPQCDAARRGLALQALRPRATR